MIDTKRIDPEGIMNELYRRFYDSVIKADAEEKGFHQNVQRKRQLLEEHFPRFRKGGASDLSVMDDLYITETFLKTYTLAERIAKNGK